MIHTDDTVSSFEWSDVPLIRHTKMAPLMNSKQYPNGVVAYTLKMTPGYHGIGGIRLSMKSCR